jgi:hypothetical protein
VAIGNWTARHAKAVLRWRFRPVHVNGATVEARGLVPIKFDLSRS